jgi:hypothetical protein
MSQQFSLNQFYPKVSKAVTCKFQKLVNYGAYHSRIRVGLVVVHLDRYFLQVAQ